MTSPPRATDPRMAGGTGRLFALALPAHVLRNTPSPSRRTGLPPTRRAAAADHPRHQPRCRRPGSFAEAVNAKGPRIVVFEVGGVIDLGVTTLRISEPHLTIAGQTAPAPGITLIRGGIDIATHDVIVRHIRVRPGDAGQPRRSGVDFDAISTVRAHNVIVDHCSLTWGTDEGLSVRQPLHRGRHDAGGSPQGHRAASPSATT